jgi:hypothetical protein
MEDDTDKKMMKALGLLDKDMQEHFKAVVRMVSICYTDPHLYSGVVVVRRTDEDILIISLNANEMDAAELITAAGGVITDVVTESAPPREQFN